MELLCGVKANEHGIPIEDEIEKPICRVCKKVVPAKRYYYIKELFLTLKRADANWGCHGNYGMPVICDSIKPYLQ